MGLAVLCERLSRADPLEVDRVITPQSDRQNLGKNTLRRAILWDQRSEILDPLPNECSYVEAQLEASDIDDLYLVPCYDWYFDSGSTFRLRATLEHLAVGRGSTVFGPAAIRARLEQHGSGGEHLIVTSREPRKPPCTIIDGTHRAAALLQMEEDRPGSTLPWNAILITSPRMSDYCWHIESRQAQEVLSTIYPRYVAEGRLW